MSTIDREKLLHWISENADPPGWNDTILVAELVAAIESGELDINDATDDDKRAPYQIFRDLIPVAEAIDELADEFRDAYGHTPGCECGACAQLAETLGATRAPWRE